MKTREGDLIRTQNGVVFDVKGLVHPPDRIIAFPRFIPSVYGPRRRGARRYGKVYSLPERFKFLAENMPDLIVYDAVFDEEMCEVPVSIVEKHYTPVKALKRLRQARRLDSIEQKAVEIVEELKNEAGIPWSAIGISGSVSVKLHTERSDLDPVVYGESSCRKAYDALSMLLGNSESRFKPYSADELKVLFDFRSKDTVMPLEDFLTVETRKAFQGKFMGTDYFVRFVKDFAEIDEKYGDVVYRNCGYARIKAKVSDASEALFTPCVYLLEDVEVLEGAKHVQVEQVASFRGRFCMQAKNGEWIVAQGKVEKVADRRVGRDYYRLLLGNSSNDYMILSGF
jgi:hypothetical protein